MPEARTQSRPYALVATMLLIVFACDDHHSPAEPGEPPFAAAVADGGATVVMPGFHFLPPIGSQPAQGGELDTDLLPWVRVTVCAHDAASACSQELAAFTAAGDGAGRLRVDPAGAAYHVNWPTPREPGVYRVSVDVAGIPLGHTDVMLVHSASELRGLSGHPPGAIAGRTLPVRFRIEKGAGGIVLAGPAGATITGLDGRVTLSVPAGALSALQPLAIRPLDTPDVENGFTLLPDDVPFLTPALLIVDAGILDQPLGDDGAVDPDLAVEHVLHAEDPEIGWQELASGYDSATGLVTLEVDGTFVERVVQPVPPDLPPDEELPPELLEGDAPDPAIDDDVELDELIDPFVEPTVGDGAASLATTFAAVVPQDTTDDGGLAGATAVQPLPTALQYAQAARPRSNRYRTTKTASTERSCYQSMYFDPPRYTMYERQSVRPTLELNGGRKYRILLSRTSATTSSEYLTISGDRVGGRAVGSGGVRAEYGSSEYCTRLYANGSFHVTLAPVQLIYVSATRETWVKPLEPGMQMQLVARLTDIYRRDVTGQRHLRWWSATERRWLAPTNAGHVDKNGLFHATGQGVVWVGVSAWNARGGARIVVGPLRAHHITASVAALDLEVGESQQVTVEMFTWNGQPLDKPARFRLGGSDIVQPDWDGDRTITITGLKPGQATLSVTGPGAPPYTLDIPITVTGARVHRVEVTPTAATIEAGQTQPFTATVYGRDDVVLDRAVSWSVAGSATIDEVGVATGTAVGDATIIATADGVSSAPVTLNVTERTTRVLTVEPATVTLEVGGTHALTVTTLAHDGTAITRPVSFTVEPAGPVTVSSTGVISAHAAGAATVTVSSDDQQATVDVTVNAPPPPPPAQLRIGGFDAARSLTTSSGQIWDFITSAAYGLARAEISAALPHATFVAGTGAVTESYLRDVDVFVVNKLDQGLGTDEICRLNTFVAGGGAVFDTRAIGGGDLLLGTTWGAHRQTGTVNIVAPASPLANGPFGNVGSSIAVGFHDVYGSTADALVVGHDGVGPAILQFSEHATRLGRAVLVSDDEVFLDGADCCAANKLQYYPQNRVLLRNIFAWLEAAPGLDPATDFSACGASASALTSAAHNSNRDRNHVTR